MTAPILGSAAYPNDARGQGILRDYLNRLLAVDSTTEPALEVVIPISIPDAATGDIDIVVASKLEVIDVWCVKRAGAGAANTMQVKNGATAITEAMACAVDDTVTRASTIVDGAGTNVIAAGGTLRVTATRAAGTRTAQVFVKCLMRA